MADPVTVALASAQIASSVGQAFGIGKANKRAKRARKSSRRALLEGAKFQFTGLAQEQDAIIGQQRAGYAAGNISAERGTVVGLIEETRTEFSKRFAAASKQYLADFDAARGPQASYFGVASDLIGGVNNLIGGIRAPGPKKKGD